MHKSIRKNAFEQEKSKPGLKFNDRLALIGLWTTGPGWRETKWSKVPCLRKKRDGWGLNPGTPDPEFEVLTTRPHTPPQWDAFKKNGTIIQEIAFEQK